MNISPVSASTLAGAASAAPIGSVQGAAAMLVMRQAMAVEAVSAIKLLETLPQPPLASSGALGTRVNTYA